MKKLLIIISLSAFQAGTCDLAAQTLMPYERAFKDFIANSPYYQGQSCYAYGDFVAVEELIPFDQLSFIFSSQLDSLNNSVTEASTPTLSNPRQVTRFGKKRSRMKIFFSESKNGVFFAEASCTRNKSITLYKSMPPFGTVVVFLFKIESPDCVSLIKSFQLTKN